MKSKTYRIVLKQVGGLLIILGFILAVPSAVSLIYKEWYSAAGFLSSALLVSGFGFLFYRGFYDADEPQYNHAYIIAASGWLIMTIMGGLPFFIIAYITPADVLRQFVPQGSDYISSLFIFRNPLHAFFESMSAYTTTGLSMAVHEPSVGKGVLFYRSFAQWIGGAGFIIMALAFLKQGS